jgi:hypothetical protein
MNDEEILKKAMSIMAKRSNESQRKGLTKKQYGEKMSCRFKKGWKWCQEKKACIQLGVDFSSNILKNQ